MDAHLQRPRMQAHADPLPLAIRRSWARCAALGDSLDAAPLTLARGDLDDRRVQHAQVLRAAQPELDTLANLVAGAASMVVLADATGVILEAAGDTGFLRRADRVALRPGVSWSENHRGTNAVGTALMEASPVRVHGAEHFLRPNQILSCHASPIRSPRGEVVGVLDISSDAARLHAYTLGLATLFARQIGNRVIEQAPATQYIVLHQQAWALDSAERGLLQLDGERIVGANDAALAALHADWASLLDQPATDWLPEWKSLGSQAGPIRTRGGLIVHAWLHRPQGLRVAVPALPASAPDRPAEPPSPPQTPLAHAARGTATPLLPELAESLLAGFEHALRALDGGLSVLLEGETGTGKEVYARHLHARSGWREGPFVAINCGALPETLVEAELFGYEAGAYTGARRGGFPGRLREADGGILFLDEIGDMPLPLQTRLLRVLQERTVQPLGSVRSVPVRFGVLSATNRPLSPMIGQGGFRADLYYRLRDVGIALPGVRERADLRRFLCATLRQCAGGAGPILSDEALARLAAYDWPGNYRQLLSVVRGLALVHPAGAVVLPSDLPEEIGQGSGRAPGGCARPRNPNGEGQAASRCGPQPGPSAPAAGPPATLHELQAQRITQALAQAQGNISQAARGLGIHRSTLHRHLARTRGQAAAPDDTN